MGKFMHIGDRLREERKRLGYNQTDFGALGGVERKTQYNYEFGNTCPDAAYLERIEKVGADVVYIQTGERSTAREFERRLDVVANVSRQAVALYLSKAQTDLLQRIMMAAETGDSTTLVDLLRSMASTPDEAALLDNYRHSPPEAQAALRATSAALAKCEREMKANTGKGKI